MLTSAPVWGIIVFNTASDWGAYTLLTNIPTYMRDVLKFDIKSVFVYLRVPVRAAFADREKIIKVWSVVVAVAAVVAGVVVLVSGQSPYPLQAFRNSSNSRHLETHFSKK